MRRTRIVLAAVVLLLTALTATAEPAAAATLPPGFADTLVAGMSAPIGIAFTPDGRVLVTQQGGQLRVVQGGALLATPALDLSAGICSNSERGMLGVAVDPNFTSNQFVYLYYSAKKDAGCTSLTVNRVSRFVLPPSNVISPASETILVDNMPSTAGNHNAGDVQFGKDGNLYISVGDGGCDYAGGGCQGSNDASRDQFKLVGKVLRITPSGAIPATNPFQTATDDRCNVTGGTVAGHRCQETYGWGFRNPFRMAFDPNAPSTVFRINDVGETTWEEIDQGIAGADYGWNVREGHCANGSTTNCGAPPAGMTNPIFDYQHGSCNAITGGAFVPNGVWSGYDGHYLYADYICGKIFDLVPNGPGFTAVTFGSGFGGGGPVTLAFGPNGAGTALYYTTYANGGQLRVITGPSGGGTNPTAVIHATPTSGAHPLTVAFDGSDSSDPQGDPLTFVWNFGDGKKAKGALPAVNHQYRRAGTYTATLKVRDNHGNLSPTVSVVITVS